MPAQEAGFFFHMVHGSTTNWWSSLEISTETGAIKRLNFSVEVSWCDKKWHFTEYLCTLNHQVISPNVFNMDLWVQSGHAANYREDMFILEVCLYIYVCVCSRVWVGGLIYISRWVMFILMYPITHVLIIFIFIFIFLIKVLIIFMNDLCGPGTIYGNVGN